MYIAVIHTCTCTCMCIDLHVHEHAHVPTCTFLLQPNDFQLLHQLGMSEEEQLKLALELSIQGTEYTVMSIDVVESCTVYIMILLYSKPPSFHLTTHFS